MTEQEEMYLGDISADELEILKDLKEEFTAAMKSFLTDVSSLNDSPKYSGLSKEIKINASFNLLFIKMVTELNEYLIEKTIKDDVSFKQTLNVYKCLMEAANESFDTEIALYAARKEQ